MNILITNDQLTKSFSTYPDEYQEEYTIDGKELSFKLQKKNAENAIKMLLVGESYKRQHDQIYSTILDISQTYVVWENLVDKILNYLEGDRHLVISPENFYITKVSDLPNIEAIVYEILPDTKHFTTILSKRDIETREKIYNIEMKMFETFKSESFKFSVNHINKPYELDSIIKNKNVLFHKRSIYASSR